jgi:hypothetical protein
MLSPPELLYAIDKLGSTPAGPGGTTKGTEYVALPKAETAKLPESVPAVAVSLGVSAGGNGELAGS